MGASYERGSILGLFLSLSSIPKDPRNPEVSDCMWSTVWTVEIFFLFGEVIIMCFLCVQNFFIKPSRQNTGEMEAVTARLRDYIKFNCDQMTQVP